MTGFRIGVVATGPAWLIEAMSRLQSRNSGNPAAVSQAAAVAAFEGPQEFLGRRRETFRPAPRPRRRSAQCDPRPVHAGARQCVPTAFADAPG